MDFNKLKSLGMGFTRDKDLISGRLPPNYMDLPWRLYLIFNAAPKKAALPSSGQKKIN